MAIKNKIYKCEICGNIVEVMIAGQGGLVCCGQEMEELQERTQDEGSEKHVPVIEKTDKGFKVTVGDVPHPMEPGHYIQFIELLADGKFYRKNLKAGDTPEAEFCIAADEVSAREYCNKHGLWKA